MIIFVDGHKFHYETENLCRVFFPFDNIKVLRENCDWQVYTGEKSEKGEYTLTVSLKLRIIIKLLQLLFRVIPLMMSGSLKWQLFYMLFLRNIRDTLQNGDCSQESDPQSL